ncbi:hypothetical protein E2C06_33605 [Dankookia rubra]|uniref:Uncharacterized protein n=1 Tax=Dankookia rubra TaxID=1442381 RepID=A0A4R5Q5T5_9PROT|nr:hypothetical protein [Dankookia rubra]TDH58252.1 hypothetical protein E2C06_33605 [Dankookia rubra]
MTDLKETLTLVASFGALGAFIDFSLSEQQQKRIRSFLEEWWIRFSYVKLSNFGREELAFTIQSIDKFFGSSIFSVRRLISVSVIYFVSLLIAIFINSFWQYSEILHNLRELFSGKSFSTAHGPALVVSFIMSMLSISLTRFVTLVIYRCCGRHSLVDFALFLTALFVQYVILCIWGFLSVDFFHFINDLMLVIFNGKEYQGFRSFYFESSLGILRFQYGISWLIIFSPSNLLSRMRQQFDSEDSYIRLFWDDLLYHTIHLSLHILNGSRFLVSLIFVISFLLKPFLETFSLLWRRAIESNKPIFTLVFGAAAGFCKIVADLLARL